MPSLLQWQQKSSPPSNLSRPRLRSQWWSPAQDEVVASISDAVEAIEPPTEEPLTQAVDSVEPEALDMPATQETSALEATEHVAYEEYLKDSNQPVNLFQAETPEETAQVEESAAAQAPVARIDPSGELRIEMDTKNAHVWNELGNVYFNTGAFDDAVFAYSKAIELDRWFAWPYSNLALAYVQKGRYRRSDPALPAQHRTLHRRQGQGRLMEPAGQCLSPHE